MNGYPDFINLHFYYITNEDRTSHKKRFLLVSRKRTAYRTTQSNTKKYPEVKSLYGYDHMLAYSTLALVIIQFTIAYFINQVGTLPFILITYFIGATITHALFLAIHEITHYLAFKNKNLNNWLAIFANLPIIFPYAMGFQVYHAMHHWEQGKDKVDTNIPSQIEAKIFHGTIGKFIWAFNQILFYALRPVFVYPIKLKKWQIINIIVQVSAMVIILPLLGWSGVIYLLLSAFLAGSLHPAAGHFIAEHYVFKEGQETYSYYGPLNLITFNVGYHNEHHDFPAIPSSRLPKLRKIAPEFYNSLYIHKSWIMVLINFILKPSVSLYSRIKRK